MFINKNKTKTLPIHPPERSIYAWNAEHAGDFIVFVNSLTDCYEFIYLPGADYFYLTVDEFDSAVKKNILEFVEQLPEDVYNETLDFAKHSSTKR